MKGEYEKGRGRDENFDVRLFIARRRLAEDRRGDQLKETKESAEAKRKVQERGLNEILAIVKEGGEDAGKIKTIAQHCRNAR